MMSSATGSFSGLKWQIRRARKRGALGRAYRERAGLRLEGTEKIAATSEKEEQPGGSTLFALPEGFPAWEGLRMVMLFLLFPAILVLAITITGGQWPKELLYTIAILLGAFVAASALRTSELILACLLLYLPFSKVYVIPLAPMINGTNALLLLGMAAAVLQANAHRDPLFRLDLGRDGHPASPGLGLVLVRQHLEFQGLHGSVRVLRPADFVHSRS